MTDFGKGKSGIKDGGIRNGNEGGGSRIREECEVWREE